MKKYFHHTYFLLVSLCIICGCTKTELPSPTSNEPIFEVSANVQSQDFIVQAGMANYFLFSGFRKDDFDVHTFSGRFEQIDCGSACGDILTFEIRDFQQIATEDFLNIEESLVVGNYFYQRAEGDTVWVIDTVEIDLLADFDASASEGSGLPEMVYNWSFGDNIVATFLEPFATHTYSNIGPIPNLPIFNVELSMSNNVCSSNQKQVLTINNTGISTCGVYIEVQKDSTPIGLPESLTAHAEGNPPFAYLWNVQNQTTSTIDYQTGGGITTTPSVTVTDSNGCVAEATAFVSPSGQQVCSANFKTSLELMLDTLFIPIVETNEFDFSKVSIDYFRAADSTLFSTDFGVQTNPDSFFEILEIEDFENNENDQRTKKLTIQFHCQLFASNGEVLEMKDGQGVIAVAYPN